ncbi:hypothetical protein [Streptomyces sp. NPDC001068]|uniref:hypothetical protein n=1 Tax=Streptomyces sp. NPDC001068 TaxID=3364544 RepID=UPI00367D9E18
MSIRTRLVSWAAVTASALAMAVATAGPASASIGTGRVQLCSQGNYASRFTFNNNYGVWYGDWVPAGSCGTFNVVGDVNYLTWITVQGHYNTSGDTFGMAVTDKGATVYATPGTSGRKFATTGTTAANDHWWVEYPNV